MADIFSGNGFTLSYNIDTGNRLPKGVGNVKINQLAAFPILNIKSTTQNLETYDSEYQTLLLGSQDVSPLDIVVNYIATDTTHKYLDNAASNSTEFQLVMTYFNDGQIVYAILNGVITASAIAGDQNAVVTKTFTFQPTALVTRSTYAYATDPLYQGDFGVGSNGVSVPQYETSAVTGNGFIKFPANMANNPAGADLMGFGTVDSTDNQALVMTKTGALNVYAKNQTTAWTRIYTVTQSDATYVPLTRTVNGHALSSNVVVTKADVGLGTLTDNPQLKIGSNLSDLANVVTARSNLSLGTSAIVNTGTSGATIPLLSTANTWSGVQTFVGRTFITSLSSTTAGTFDGTANVTQGVTGILPLVNGGTGNATGVSTNVSGVVAVANGGTGATTALAAAQSISALPIMTTFSDADVNTIVTAGVYSCTSISPNIPLAVTGTMEVLVRQGGLGITQVFHANSTSVGFQNRHYIRTGTTASGTTTWTSWNSITLTTTNVASSTDLNTLLASGRYYGNYTNSPSGSTGSAIVDVTNTGNDTLVYQSFTFTTTNVTWTRRLVSAVWSDWVQLYASNAKPSATDVGALSITGGTLTGALAGTSAVFSGAVQQRENNITYRQLLSRTDAFSPYTGYNRIDQVDGTLPSAQTLIGEATGRLTTTAGDPWGRTLGGLHYYYDTTGGGSTMISARNAAGNIASSITFAGDTGIATMRGSLITNAISATSLVLTTALPVASGGTGNANGTVGQLTTARTFLTSLSSTTAGSFNGSANVTQGVSGILPLTNGGTGNDTGTAVNVSGVVALANGGTGASTAAAARTSLGVAYGTAAGTVAQGNDTRLNTVEGKTGGTITGNTAISGNLICGAQVTAGPAGFYTQGINNPSIQGTYTGWNGTGLSGATDFLCNRGSGDGGFRFRIVNSGNTAVIADFSMLNNGVGQSSGGWTALSDVRVKNNITAIDPETALRAVCSWNPVTWQYADTPSEYDEAGTVISVVKGANGVGYLAQDIQKDCPSAVSISDNPSLHVSPTGELYSVEETLTLNTLGVSAGFHGAAIQALTKRIESLMARIESLENTTTNTNNE